MPANKTFAPGDRVKWKTKDKTEMLFGTVVDRLDSGEWSDYYIVELDAGNRRVVRSRRLSLTELAILEGLAKSV